MQPRIVHCKLLLTHDIFIWAWSKYSISSLIRNFFFTSCLSTSLQGTFLTEADFVVYTSLTVHYTEMLLFRPIRWQTTEKQMKFPFFKVFELKKRPSKCKRIPLYNSVLHSISIIRHLSLTNQAGPWNFVKLLDIDHRFCPAWNFPFSFLLKEKTWKNWSLSLDPETCTASKTIKLPRHRLI